MARVIRLTEQELKGILSDLIKMSFSGINPKDDSKTQDSEDGNSDDNTSSTYKRIGKVSAKGQQLLDNPIFKEKLKEISSAIHIDERSIIKLMKHESGLDPTIKNSIGCVGLIQFCPGGGMPKTINGKSYTLDEIRYDLEAQMDAIKEFWTKGYNNGKIKRPADLYLYNFFPVAAGKPDDFVLQAKGLSASTVSRANPGFNKKLGKPVSSPLTVGDMKRYYQETGMA